jgi:exodeoxyribonuclease V beta subunit
VAEGTPLEKLLLVTFTRMATGELRERVRERLVSAERALRTGDTRDDRLAQFLASENRTARRANLSNALADFDAATIATIHGFCQEVLGGLGIAGDVERDVEFLEDVTDMVEEVVDDLYVRRFFKQGQAPFGRAEAGKIAQLAIANPTAPIEPRNLTDDSRPAMRARLAEAVRRELDLRKQRAAVMTHDDLLTRLDSTLAGPGGPVVIRRLRERFKVVLVDEFQDTDPVQWSIVRQAFGDGTLVLIGDPKQAIYSFRGADVYAYLDAKREAANHATLDVNRRSDQGLIDAYDALFGNAHLGHEGIVYREVTAFTRESRLTDAGAPMRIRVVHRDEPGIERTARGYATVGSARAFVAKDLAADLVRLLDSDARVKDEPVKPGHIAVLVQTNRTAAMVRDALDEVAIPAVINGAGSVFGTAPARDWLRLLEALERPTSTPRAHAAALTPFSGWSAEKIATARDEDWEVVHQRLHDWARVLRLRGVASVSEAIMVAEGLPERILKLSDGERRLTDLRHVSQLLHAAAMSEQLGTTALVAWLRRRIAEADQDTADEDRSRRLESDAEAVQVLTVHRSKGLEFPIVYYPYLWEPSYIPSGVPVAFHDPDANDVRTIDVGLEGSDFTRHKKQELIEQRGEDLRLAYVALTRARHQAVVWWAPSFNSRDSAIGRLLFARQLDGSIPAEARNVPTDAAAMKRFGALAGQVPGRVTVERASLGMPASWGGLRRGVDELEVARFGRELDLRWRRTSFSDITSGAHEARVSSEPEETQLTDEPATAVRPSAPPGDEALRAIPSPLGAMPAGVRVGTFIHRVLEATDFAAPDLKAELRTRIADVQAYRPVEIGDPAIVVAGLKAAIETPLDGYRLRDLTKADRLDELDFELPLVGGDTPTSRLALDAIADVLKGDSLPTRLDDPMLRRSVRGYVTGSIDLVARVGERYTVVDYKTNWLAGPEEELTAWHHRQAALRAEMERAHYGLQALLYTVALHRYLRWRLRGYDPARNLGGVLYLFLRGMVGPETPPGCGVFAWRPSAALVEALSDVLDKGS